MRVTDIQGRLASSRNASRQHDAPPLPVAGIKHDTIDGFSRVPLAQL
jgi:hypothetical protein